MHRYSSRNRSIWPAMGIFLLAPVFSPAQAVTGGSGGTEIKIFGTLVEPPPCQINNNQVIDVPFGEIGVNRIDGKNYLQQINAPLDCKTSEVKWDLWMEVHGQATAFDKAAIQSSVTDLGIQLMMDGQPLELNKPVLISPVPALKFEAVPVKKAGAELPEGAFDASATLLVEYQ
ncbi:putative minor fimbrial subunit StfF [Serratia rubidaea]|uniref:fimbrial protein n=1 Tax=Serratia rubidaea TaxID=61652 RepID=UPI0006C75C65|nr:fimbrial protein [Serratia rubidaea]QPR63428.1 fimbrial protein [Serratia rubidaea]CAI0729197.1 putative minor fimbrial subunit StfF [Serratia rubidaea]CAI1536081.1 putative minor fimbrial subunit StfF [Serratia rubidaea]HAY0635430.1 fimbrial protein [Serratia rubidaea]